MKTLREKSLEQLVHDIGELHGLLIRDSSRSTVFESLRLVNEAQGLTYYELRQFLALLLKQVSNKSTKEIISDLLKTISSLEIMHVPVPVIRKQKSISPTVF